MKIRNVTAVTLLLIVSLSVWIYFGSPTSVSEFTFMRRVAALKSTYPKAIELREMMPGDWEMVCDSHGYDGPLYIKKYNRTYEPAAPPSDGAWGLIFIRSDGTFTEAVGSCRYPKVELDVNGCKEARSVRLFLTSQVHESCPIYRTQ
ncbi:MAG: hypothetical protein HYX42_09960 [Polaromonas sp.]|uniref:hypothetical protein n=1 Tax=Polaromonas sp. TaxID=1869339 RepID=UPI0025D296C0|nr:hypothetical protein [Polaromonas sp.]MBI2726559.1 hypothetical protein [Polaromonas sp.]